MNGWGLAPQVVIYAREMNGGLLRVTHENGGLLRVTQEEEGRGEEVLELQAKYVHFSALCPLSSWIVAPSIWLTRRIISFGSLPELLAGHGL